MSSNEKNDLDILSRENDNLRDENKRLREEISNLESRIKELEEAVDSAMRSYLNVKGIRVIRNEIQRRSLQ